MIDLFNPYAWIMRLRRWLYRVRVLRSVGVGTTVISVGNLSAGGTGKTPFTMFLVRYLQERFGVKCAVVLRGYKRESSGQVIVRDWNTIRANPRRSGDEATLYANELSNTVVICDADRVRGARMAREMGADVIVLDDGYQHLRLRRDLDILLVNALEGIPPVMPFGKGREVPTAASAADLIVITNSGDGDEPLAEALTDVSDCPISRVTNSIIRFRAVGEPHDDTNYDLAGKRVLALSGIGMPQGFENSLAPKVGKFVALRFPDHTIYDADALRMIEKTAAEEHCDMIVTTSKDEVKLVSLLSARTTQLPFVVAESEIAFERNEEAFIATLNAMFTTITT